LKRRAGILFTGLSRDEQRKHVGNSSTGLV
jgi:hypothetical protein